MKKSKKILLGAMATSLLLGMSGCGGESNTSGGSALNSENYIKVAKSVYAQKDDGRVAPGELEKSSVGGIVLKTFEGAEKEKDIFFQKSYLKSFDDKIVELVVGYNNQTLTISTDKENKYATIDLDGQSTVVNMKEFTQKDK